MKIQPSTVNVAPPSEGGQSAPTATTPAQTARERALNAFMKPVTQAQVQAQAHPVSNPTNVSPEEMSAIVPPTSEDSRQTSNSVETSSEAPKAETKGTEETLSSQYAILARKEKALRLRDQQLRQKEATIKAQEDAARAALAPKAPTFDESKYVSRDKLAQDPFSVLAELGLSYDQLTNLALNAPKPEEVALKNQLAALRAEIDSLKGEQNNTKKSWEDQQQASYKQAVNQIRQETQQLVSRDPAFETIRETKSVGDVVELIERTFNEDGILLSVEEAAQQVEEYLVDEAMKLTKIKKIQQRLQPAAKPAAKATEAPKQQQPMKTLTNSVSSSRQLTARERALLAFEGKLNK